MIKKRCICLKNYVNMEAAREFIIRERNQLIPEEDTGKDRDK